MRRILGYISGMFETTSETDTSRSPLTGPGDPPVIEPVNPEGGKPLLIICDHASPAMPAALGNLGLDESALETHITYDIGAAEVVRMLAERLDAPALMAGYSRLLIDCNRQPGDPYSIPKVSDGVTIPGNLGLGEEESEARAQSFFWPYHHAITSMLAHLWRQGPVPALFSIHSFTPTLGGEDRFWDIGVLWNRDPRLAQPLLAKLRARDDLLVGDNEPYSGRQIAYTIDLHGGAGGLPNCAVEIRQDHLESPQGTARWAAILGDAFEDILGIDDLNRVEHY